MKTIIEVFGSQKLGRFSPSSVADLNIPGESKDFLTATGLPIGIDWTMNFDPSASRLPHASINELRVIGHDGDAQICLDENRAGRVVVLEPSGNLRLINSSVKRFGTCLALYQSYRSEVRALDEDAALILIDQIENGMQGVDKAAFANPEFWWPVIISQMREANL